jgi:hypothetical protein
MRLADDATIANTIQEAKQANDGDVNNSEITYVSNAGQIVQSGRNKRRAKKRQLEKELRAMTP